MTDDLRGYAIAKSVWEIASSRWMGPRHLVRGMWYTTFAEEMPVAPETTFTIDGRVFEVYPHAPLESRAGDARSIMVAAARRILGIRFVVHYPDGVSEIRALDLDSRLRTLGEAAQDIVQLAATQLGFQLPDGFSISLRRAKARPFNLHR